MQSRIPIAATLGCILTWIGSAGATEPPAPLPAAPPAPYSVPWQLRPVMPVSVVRSDTTLALYEKPGKEPGSPAQGTFTVASMLLASYKVTPDFAPFLRIGFVGTPDGAAVTNLATGATLGVPLGSNLRMGLFLGLALPLGGGGGNTPDATALGAIRSGVLDRSAMDNAMFAVNDVTLFPGIDVAYVAGGLTVQVEATLLALTRAQGEEAQKDSSKTNFTTGLHVGYFFLPWLSVGAELRYQRWLSVPAAVAADSTGDSRDNLSFAAGPRAHFPVGKTLWIRPGVSYARGLDLPMSNAGYNIVQLDVPVVF
ncbi:MAG: hypothetical protein R3B70_04970 [Polyangiaceae bacterium]